jgi:redox-sensitive bicupin YhaK (pirin superfamily)
MVGPFIFLDHMGPAAFAPGAGIDVRPHPHIGLATVTYLFEGELVHRDSLGCVQTIRPGDVNWMTAGSGIVHSERSSPQARSRSSRLHGCNRGSRCRPPLRGAPAFHHHPADTLPALDRGGARLRVIAGSATASRRP